MKVIGSNLRYLRNLFYFKYIVSNHYRICSQMLVFERGCNLLQIVPVGISGTILACSSVGGNNSICMNFQLIQNLVSTPVKNQNVNGIQRPLKNRRTLQIYRHRPKLWTTFSKIAKFVLLKSFFSIINQQIISDFFFCEED